MIFICSFDFPSFTTIFPHCSHHRHTNSKYFVSKFFDQKLFDFLFDSKQAVLFRWQWTKHRVKFCFFISWIIENCRFIFSTFINDLERCHTRSYSISLLKYSLDWGFFFYFLRWTEEVRNRNEWFVNVWIVCQMLNVDHIFSYSLFMTEVLNSLFIIHNPKHIEVNPVNTFSDLLLILLEEISPWNLIRIHLWTSNRLNNNELRLDLCRTQFRSNSISLSVKVELIKRVKTSRLSFSEWLKYGNNLDRPIEVEPTHLMGNNCYHSHVFVQMLVKAGFYDALCCDCWCLFDHYFEPYEGFVVNS